MPILDLFRQALSGAGQQQVSPQQIAKAVGGIASAMEAYASDQTRALLTHIIIPWALGVSRLAPSKWVLPANIAPSCAFEHGHGEVCGSFAVGGCHVCGRPICMAHALVAGDATLVCWTCLRLAAKHATPWKPPTSPGGGSGDLGWAYELLGVDPDCSDAQVKQAYRKRISQFHPDVQPGGSSKPHEDIVRLITKAFEAIKASRGMD